MHIRVGVGVVLGGGQLQYLSSRWGAGAGTSLLAEEALQDGAGRTVGHEVPFFAAEEATWRAAIHLTPGRAIKGWLFIVILVDVAGGYGRRRLSCCSDCCGWVGISGHGGYRCGRGPVSSDLFVGLFEILFQESDLLFYGVDQALHLSVCLLIEYLFYSPSGCYDVFRCFVA